MIASISSCKPPTRSFKYEQNVNLYFFKKMETILKAKIDSVKIYRAVLEDVLVERDNVTEYKQINTESKQAIIDFQVDNNYAHLFLMQIFTTPFVGRPCIFFSTSYSADSSCTHLGPAYLGLINLDHINVIKELAIKQSNKYYLKSWKNKKMDFITFNKFPQKDDLISKVKIKQIILQDPNKIGGIKPTLYTITDIFKDKNALAFTYLETIKKGTNESKKKQ